MYDGVYHPPLGRFSMVDISTVGIVSVPKRSALKSSRRELSEYVSFGIGSVLVRYWHPLGCRAVEFGKPPQRCVMYTVVLTIR